MPHKDNIMLLFLVTISLIVSLKREGTLVASHLISEHPCETRAALELLPRFIPSTIPAAIASTFLRAPVTSTPVTSLEFIRGYESGPST